MTADTPTYDYWRDYPERDPQAMVWYPLAFGPLDADAVWPIEGPPPREETSFYVHVPFCAVICPFCPFNKFASVEQQMHDFVVAVKREISILASRSYWSDAEVRAGYFGGGTPTALSGEQLCEIVVHCKENFKFREDIELTVEGSPETMSLAKLRMLKDVGVNRISFGVQSFSDRNLKILGRGHDALTARRTVDLVLDAGFDNVAIDLMYRLPGQTLHEWQRDLREAIRSGVHHISTYSLFLEPGSPLARVRERGKLLPLPDEKTDLEMFRMAIDILGEAGYGLYTLYDFARPSKQCDHHLVNWRAPQAEYVGIGPGAFGFVRHGDEEFVYGNANPLESYFETLANGCLPIDFGVRLPLEERMARYMVLGTNALRIPKAPFEQRFGVPMSDVYKQKITELARWGLVEDSGDELSLTLRGKLYLANVGKSFCTEPNRMMPHPAGVYLQKGEGLSLRGLPDVPDGDR